MTRARALLPALACIVGVTWSASGCERAVLAPRSAEVAIDIVAGGDPQSAVVTGVVPILPSVRVRDADGRPLVGARVVFIPLGNRGSVAGGVVDTDADGIATVAAWTLSTVAGLHELSVITTASTSTASVLFRATATPGPVAGIAAVPSTVSVAPGGTRALTISTVDQYGNVVVAGVSAAFAATNPAIASVTPAGVVSGATVGVTRITMSFGAFVGSVWTAVGSRPTGTSVVTAGVGQGAYGIAFSSADVLYVGADTYVARYNLPSENISATVLGVDRVLGLAFSPDGATAWVASFMLGQLHVVDVATHTILRSITGLSNPTRVVVSADGAFAYVTAYGGSLLRVNTATDAVTELRLTGRLNGMALSGTRPALYVTSVEGTVFDVDLATFTLRRTGAITGGFMPAAQGIAVSLDGTRLFVANEGGALQVLDATTLIRRATVAAANGAFGVALTRDASQLYVAQSAQNRVTVIDADTYAVVRTFAAIFPRQIAFSHSGSLGIVTNEGGGTAYFVR